MKEILRRPKVTYNDIKYIAEIMENIPNLSFDEDTEYQIEVQVKYEGYIAKAKQRLKEKAPYNVGQASRISGVTPADISVLLMYLEGVLKQ